jgi:hypothetical protein
VRNECPDRKDMIASENAADAKKDLNWQDDEHYPTGLRKLNVQVTN